MGLQNAAKPTLVPDKPQFPIKLTQNTLAKLQYLFDEGKITDLGEYYMNGGRTVSKYD